MILIYISIAAIYFVLYPAATYYMARVFGITQHDWDASPGPFFMLIFYPVVLPIATWYKFVVDGHKLGVTHLKESETPKPVKGKEEPDLYKRYLCTKCGAFKEEFDEEPG